VNPTGGNVVDLPLGAASATSFGFIFQNVGKALLAAQLTALQEEGKLNILSSPSITTLDNQTAYTISQSAIGKPVGDHVLLERTNLANSGEMVVAMLEDGSVTLKRLRRDNGQIFLVPENPAFHYHLGMAYVATGYNVPKLIAIRLGDASGDVTKSHIAWEATRRMPKTPSMIATHGQILVLDDTGTLTSLDGKSGKPVWNEKLPGNFSASPILTSDTLYAVTEDGVCYVVKISPDAAKIVFDPDFRNQGFTFRPQAVEPKIVKQPEAPAPIAEVSELPAAEFFLDVELNLFKALA
jgi:outer membrane protein assembly factor BamB